MNTSDPDEKEVDPVVKAYELYDSGKLEESAKIFEEEGFKNMAQVIREEAEEKKRRRVNMSHGWSDDDDPQVRTNPKGGYLNRPSKPYRAGGLHATYPARKPQQKRRVKTPPIPAKSCIVQMRARNNQGGESWFDCDYDEQGKRLCLTGEVWVFPSKRQAHKAIWHTLQLGLTKSDGTPYHDDDFVYYFNLLKE